MFFNLVGAIWDGPPGWLIPSPLVGEGGERSEPGEGIGGAARVGSSAPSPASPPSLRFGGSAPSPTRGEGREPARLAGETAALVVLESTARLVLWPNSRSQRYWATLVS